MPGLAGGRSTRRAKLTLAMHKDESQDKADAENSKADDNPPEDQKRSKEIGGRGGLDPTRYGDWEKAGRCIDF